DLVLSEPPLETVTEGSFPLGPEETAFAVAYLPGQYDQRADSAAQCVALLAEGERVAVGTARVIVLDGVIGAADLARIQRYCINPVDSRQVPLTPPARLVEEAPDPGPVPVLTDFTQASAPDLDRLRADFGLAMDSDDLALCQAYFRDIEGRDPRETEIRLLDTYWSDHCRHTTFHTRLSPIRVEDGPLTVPVAGALDRCRELLTRHGQGAGTGDPTLMGIALLAMRELKSRGRLDDLEESDEINACSVAVTVPVRRDGREVQEEWLVMFKNETHNHPTEIEPYGGAATCLGGAIRDPLSGRSYVYQAMRVTGAGDPRQPVEATLPGKLPQRRITTEAAAGFSAYGNQIGLCTGQVEEYYDPGYVAKRMEVGAVIGAAPRRHVVRAKPRPGDLVVWIGGRTGRDGIGGATGSSKAHSEESLATCYAEVQKGNPPIERQLQRFFRDERIGPMIRKCNDFGAGGVAVAVGELADGVEIDLDALPRKYEGLGGTELALSESQERMAVVIAPDDLAEFLRLAASENLEAAVVATVSAIPRLRMTWRGERIVDLARDFLESHGAEKRAEVRIASPDPEASPFRPPLAGGEEYRNLADRWRASMADLAVCSRRGLVERFDSSIGRASVFFPYGGSDQGTPQPVMAARLPVTEGETDCATLMS
ncbi:MAG TPA: AIR synthase-related protein, partial [Candidatus Aminicenantes bacterium]|nr:AIR synthase-related protein [Candidatus Aminicenantes bacterium]